MCAYTTKLTPITERLEAAVERRVAPLTAHVHVHVAVCQKETLHDAET